MQEQSSEIADVQVPKDLIPADVELVGLDGNAFSIMSAVAKGLRKAGNPSEVVDSYRKQCIAGDYDHLLRVSIAFTNGADQRESP